MILVLHGFFGAEHERANHARGAASAVDECDVLLFDLAVACFAHDLARCLDDVAEAAAARAGGLAAR